MTATNLDELPADQIAESLLPPVSSSLSYGDDPSDTFFAEDPASSAHAPGLPPSIVSRSSLFDGTLGDDELDGQYPTVSLCVLA